MIVQGLQTGKCPYFGTTAEDLFPRNSKNTIQPLCKTLRSYFIHQTGHIMRYIEGVLPSISLLKSAPHLHRIEMIDKGSIPLFGMYKITLRIIDPFPSLRKPGEFLIILLLAQLFCPLGNGPRTIGIFQRMRSGKHESLIRTISRIQMRHIAQLDELIRIYFTGT